jgi:hypothetical protein
MPLTFYVLGSIAHRLAVSTSATHLAAVTYVTFATLAFPASSLAQTNQTFDGSPWHISSGNLSVSFIQASPVGAFPRPDVLEPPPSVESQVRLKNLGLVANEDYIAWGAIEREPGHWDWRQHDAVQTNQHKAGLRYVVYDWIHFPPVWLRDQQTNSRTLMRCLEHGQEANYLSIFDPHTIVWYDHFYKNLHEHFGNSIDDVYACILGPYGEGNYPLMVPDWIKMGHCHEGYWCGDDYAIQSFQIAMKCAYPQIAKLNSAWGTDYKSFDDVRPPKEISEKFKASPESFPSAQNKRRWLDFITWYHRAIIDFAEQSIRALLKYYPPEKVRAKPGGSAGGVNPIPWGTYCPGYAKMAQPYRIVLQPADCQGAIFADKWMGTAYQFYHVTECTEPAGNLAENAFVRRMFSDAAAGGSQFFSYEYEAHASNLMKYVHLLTGKSGETEIAIYCPTTLYRLGANLQPTIKAASALRDHSDFDVLDELLINDGALTTNRYKVLLLFQADIVDQPILGQFDSFLANGGRIIQIGDAAIQNVEGNPWARAQIKHVSALSSEQPSQLTWLADLSPLLGGLRGVDGKLDGLWSCRRGSQSFVFNTKDKPVQTDLAGKPITIAPFSIWSSQ